MTASVEQINGESMAAAADAATAGSSQSSQTLFPYTRVEPIPVAVGPDRAPLWRITAAVDPNTTPLDLMSVWAVQIDPRKSKNYMQFSRSVARRLRAAERGGDANERSTTASSSKTLGSLHSYINGHLKVKYQNGNDLYQSQESDGDDEEDEDSSGSDSAASAVGDIDESMKHLRLFQRRGEGGELNALVCRCQDLPSIQGVISLLKTVDVVYDGTEPMPFQVKVPIGPSPSRNRLQEWNSYWPISPKYGRVMNSVVKPSLSGQSQSPPCNVYPGVVDRAADAELWNPIAKEWAIRNFRKCLRVAWEAEKRGELPIGVHVTSSYPESDKVVSGVAEGQMSIEVNGWDTRKSERNPIKHAVTNAIKEVAKERSERDYERLLLLNAKVANLYRDPHADPDAHRQAMQKAEAAVAASMPSSTISTSSSPSSTGGAGTPNRMSNGQDYLLNNMSLFITHEPCVHCCMALIHSRVRTIFFLQPSPGAGGCCGSGLESERQCTFAQDGGPYAVQEQPGLNHRFDAWKWVGDDTELLQTKYDIPMEETGIAHGVDSNYPTIGVVRLDSLGLDA